MPATGSGIVTGSNGGSGAAQVVERTARAGSPASGRPVRLGPGPAVVPSGGGAQGSWRLSPSSAIGPERRQRRDPLLGTLLRSRRARPSEPGRSTAPRPRLLPRAVRPALHPHARRPRRRGDQGRAAGRATSPASPIRASTRSRRYFTQQNCGKRNVSLDMKQPEAVGLLHHLAEQCDVVVENFRPGVTERMGLDYDDAVGRSTLASSTARITGYGHTGPWQRRRAYASVVQAESGYIEMEGQSRGLRAQRRDRPTPTSTPPLECLTGVLAALFQRERTGRGPVGRDLDGRDHVVRERRTRTGTMTGREPEARRHPELRTGRLPGARRWAPGAASSSPATRPSPARSRSSWQLMERPDLLADPAAGRSVRTRYAHHGRRARRAGGVGGHPRRRGRDRGARSPPRASPWAWCAPCRRSPTSDWADARGAIVAVDDRGGGTVEHPQLAVALQRRRHRRAGPADVPRRGQPRGVRPLLGLDDDTLDRLEADGVLRAGSHGLMPSRSGIVPMKAVTGPLPSGGRGRQLGLRDQVGRLPGHRLRGRRQGPLPVDQPARPHPPLARDGHPPHRRARHHGRARRRDGGAGARRHAPLRAAPAGRGARHLRDLRRAVDRRPRHHEPPVRGPAPPAGRPDRGGRPLDRAGPPRGRRPGAPPGGARPVARGRRGQAAGLRSTNRGSARRRGGR